MIASTLSSFLARHDIAPEHVLAVSRRIERRSCADRDLAAARARKRRTQPEATYLDAGIAKPRSGCGVGRLHLNGALAGVLLRRRPRAKLLRALNAILAARGAAPVTATEVFGDPIPASTRAAPAV